VAGEPDPIPLFRAPTVPTALPRLAAVLASGQLAGGNLVPDFERTLGQYLGNPHVLAVSDRSAALTLALRAAGVGVADEVLLSPLVCLATSMPVLNLQARPVWCDVDPATGMLTPDTLAGRVTARTKAIITYHWGGDIGPLAALRAFADTHGLALIEDAAAAFGGEYQGRRIGNTLSDYTVLSFYAVNQLALGEGGALACRYAKDLEAIRWQRRYGIHQPSFRLPNGDLNPASDIPAGGYNFGLTNLHAAVGLAQFDTLPARLATHRANGRFFDQVLRDLPRLTALTRAPHAVSGYWVYAMRTAHRDALIAQLHACGIGAQRLHLRNDRYTCFARAAHTLPGVECFDAENLCIPCGWWVDHVARERIVACLSATH
jgi:dTDP-4-amino-4,6-dideoxygalactose transaminase